MRESEFQKLREQAGLTVDAASELLGVTPKTIRRWDHEETLPKRAFIEVLENRIAMMSRPQPDADFTFIDLFAGIGGMRIGFEAIGGRCVFTSEWDEYARRTYRANFPDTHDIAGDITKIGVNEIPEHDVLLAGFPCQPFSIAGVSKKNSLGREHGFMDKAQGTLFFDVLRILKHHRPAAFVLENVKNLQSHNKGDTFRTICGALEDDLGYHISCGVIDAGGYVPQHRERIFIAGFRQDTGFDFRRLEFLDRAQGPRLSKILHAPQEEPEAHYTVPTDEPGSNSLSRVDDRYTLSDKLWKYLEDYAAKHKAKGNGFGYGLNTAQDRARTLSARYYKDGSEILIEQPGSNPRRLTPRECARLMGFDRSREDRMVIPVSDTRAYKQFGNAVVPLVVEEIARYMKPHVMRILDPGELFVASSADIEEEEREEAVA